MRSPLAAAAALAALLALPSGASPFPQANAYFAVRDRAQLAESATWDEIQSQPRKFEGKLVEVRGVIKATAEIGSQPQLLIQGRPSGEVWQVSLPPDKGMADWPWLDVGTPIRALCAVVVLDGGPAGALELRVPVKEHEAAYVDQERARALQQRMAAQAKSAPPRTLASRGAPAYAPARISEAELLARYAAAVRYFNRRIPEATARSIAASIIKYSRRYGLDARLVMAVIAVESNFDPYAVSPKGASGLGQLMPGTAADLGVGDAFDVEANLEGSTRLLRTHIQNMRNGRPTEEAIRLALACYNAGAGAVRKYRGIPPYRETQNYVQKITRLYLQLKGDWKGD